MIPHIINSTLMGNTRVFLLIDKIVYMAWHHFSCVIAPTSSVLVIERLRVLRLLTKI